MPNEKKRGYIICGKEEAQFALAMHRLNFEGNIIPRSWFRTLRKKVKNRKTKAFEERFYTNAAIVLAEIVYWSRPIVIESGQKLVLRKRYQGDVLQKSYDDLADTLGLGKDAVRDALDYLVDVIGVVSRDFRTIVDSQGRAVNNVLFIKINVERLAQITYRFDEIQENAQAGFDFSTLIEDPIDEDDQLHTKQSTNTLSVNNTTGYQSINQEGLGQPTETNTKITSKITAEAEQAAALKTAYEERTGIRVTNKKAIRIFIDLATIGATPDDLQTAIDELQKKDKTAPILPNYLFGWVEQTVQRRLVKLKQHQEQTAQASYARMY